MSNGDSPPADAFLDQRAREFFASLEVVDRLRVQDAIDQLMADPHPDGAVKIRLPFPFLYGTIGYRCDGFFITYGFENAATLRVYTISWDTGYYFG